MGELSRRSDIADPPVQPTPAPKTDRPANADVQAQLAHLTGRKPRPTDRATDVGHQPNAKPDTGRANDARNAPEPTAELDEAQAEIAELQSRLDERDAKLDAAEAKIADLKKNLEDRDARLDAANEKISGLETQVKDQGAMLSDVLKRVSRLEHAEPEKRTGDRDLPEAHDTAGPSRADARMVTGEERQERKNTPEWVRRATSDSSLGFMSSGVGVALTEASAHMPPGPAHVATLAGGLFGFAVSGMAWIRDWRKTRNADRSQG